MGVITSLVKGHYRKKFEESAKSLLLQNSFFFQNWQRAVDVFSGFPTSENFCLGNTGG